MNSISQRQKFIDIALTLSSVLAALYFVKCLFGCSGLFYNCGVISLQIKTKLFLHYNELARHRILEITTPPKMCAILQEIYIEPTSNAMCRDNDSCSPRLEHPQKNLLLKHSFAKISLIPPWVFVRLCLGIRRSEHTAHRREIIVLYMLWPLSEVGLGKSTRLIRTVYVYAQ